MSHVSEQTSSFLMEVGFKAIKSGMYDSAQAIFEGINTKEQNSAAGDIGLATIALANGDMDKAISYLDETAFSDKQNAHEAKKLLLIASMLGGDQAKAGHVHQSLLTGSSHSANDDEKQEAEQFFSKPA